MAVPARRRTARRRTAPRPFLFFLHILEEIIYVVNTGIVRDLNGGSSLFIPVPFIKLILYVKKYVSVYYVVVSETFRLIILRFQIKISGKFFVITVVSRKHCQFFENRFYIQFRHLRNLYW